jgi:hypothetical protein
MRSRARLTLAIAGLMATAFVSGCALGTRNIAEIQSHPGRYYDRSVSIEGTVTSSFGGPFIPVQFYKVDDGTGEITVVANDPRGVPRSGARVRVKGRVGEVASFGRQSFGLHLRQQDVDVRR